MFDLLLTLQQLHSHEKGNDTCNAADYINRLKGRQRRPSRCTVEDEAADGSLQEVADDGDGGEPGEHLALTARP